MNGIHANPNYYEHYINKITQTGTPFKNIICLVIFNTIVYKLLFDIDAPFQMR